MKVALIVCGQLRSIDICIKSWKEYLFPYYDCDIYVSTQDANAIKGRIYVNPIVVNQYVFQPITYNIEEKLQNCFGKNLKKVNIRSNMYEYYTKHQKQDFVLDNSLGWAENFLDMKIALDMAGPSYDLYIKIRPDICLCQPFYQIESPLHNSIYVNDKRDNFVWDAVFAMDKEMAGRMKSFYDFYVVETKDGVRNCFDSWDCKLNAEDKLLYFLKYHNTEIINMGDVGYPITWLIGDIKNNNSWSHRHENFQQHWKNLIIEYADKHTDCHFDICDANPAIPNVPKSSICKSHKNKVALLICGQLRDYKYCLQSIYENIHAYNDCDVYVVTQDSISIKPRLGKGMMNQYLIHKIRPDKAFFVDMFGDKLKEFHVRKTYKNLIDQHRSDFVLDNTLGWTEHFIDVQKCIELALKSGEKYDYFIKVRPDILITKPVMLNYTPIPNSMYVTGYVRHSCPEVMYVMDEVLAHEMLNFHDFYTSHVKARNPWKSEHNTEVMLMKFIQSKNSKILYLRANAYPINWLVSDERNNERFKRYKELQPNWVIMTMNYLKNYRRTIFDLQSSDHS